MAFAKLYGTDDDQVLVMFQRSDDGDGPEIQFYFKPPGLGVTAMKIGGFEDTGEAWDAAERAFDAITEEDARATASAARAEVARMFAGTDRGAQE